MDADDARYRLGTLKEDLQRIVDKDQEQEVRGLALPVIDAVVTAARDFLPANDPVLAAVQDVIVSVAESGEALRAVDTLIVVSQMLVAIPIPPTTFVVQRDGPDWLNEQR